MRVFIVGWYGTETAGDKAILGAIITAYLNRYPATEFAISSIYPFVTRRTLQELGMSGEVVPAFSSSFVKHSVLSDEIVIGGGPLMDLEELSIPLIAFQLAKLAGRRRIVWGCGLGPLTQSRYLNTVQTILKLATEIRLRDSDSVAWARQLTGRDDILLISDPARDYINARKRQLSIGIHDRQPILACFLRDWPREYARHLSDEAFQRRKLEFETNLASYIRKVSKELSLTPVFYPMHSFFVGNDDREYFRRFLSKRLVLPSATYIERPVSVDGIIRAMVSAELCICMRFHSVLFAHTLGVPFLAIDYTSGGKISSFLRDQNAMAHYASVEQIADGVFSEWNSLITSFVEGRLQRENRPYFNS